MAWLKLDDQIFYNRKVAQCDTNTKMLYIVGLTYCAHQLTDGFIPSSVLPLLAGMAGTEYQIAKQSASNLLDFCLWSVTDGGWIVPDFLEYNPSREQVLHNQSVRAEAGSRGGKAKRSKLLANSQQFAKQNPSKIVPPTPSPSPLRDDGIARPPSSATVTDFPEQDPDWGAAISKLESANIGGMNGTVLLELNALWPDFANGKRDWLDDAILVAKANNAKSPVYAIRVLAGAIRDNKRPGQAPERAPQKGGRTRSLDDILGITPNGK